MGTTEAPARRPPGQWRVPAPAREVLRAMWIGVPEQFLAERRRRGLDLFDEMWEGVLHMTRLPAWEHQHLTQGLSAFFQLHWEDCGLGVAAPGVNVKPPGGREVDVAGERLPESYRGPDYVLLRKGHEDRIQGGWVVGPPDCVIEIRSPGDETYEKLAFYCALGVPEVVVIHRDTKEPEVFRRGRGRYTRVPPGPGGWTLVRQIDVQMRRRAVQGRPVLELRRASTPRRRGRA